MYFSRHGNFYTLVGNHRQHAKLLLLHYICMYGGGGGGAATLATLEFSRLFRGPMVGLSG